MLRLLFAVVMFVAAAAAQVVRVENVAPTAFEGWISTTCDKLIADSGRVVNTLFVAGRQVGLDTRMVHLRVRLGPGEARQLNLAGADDVAFRLAPLPAVAPPTIAGAPMTHVSTRPDGAGYLVHYRARSGPMFVVDLWVTRYPDEPGWCRGEAMVTASNPSVPAMSAAVPNGFALQWGDAVTVLPGWGAAVPLIAAGTVFGDGQARAVPVAFLWPARLNDATWPSALTAAQIGVAAVGIDRLLADGNPSYPVGFNARTWAQPKLWPAAALVHSWGGALCGPAMASGTAGEQEDSCFTRGEGLTCPPAAMVTWLSALKLAARPCQHREVNGDPLNAALHPQLVLWDGRPHWHTGVSPDRLGKPSGLTVENASGWWGPDVEHAMFAVLAAGARYTGSPACQQLLSSIARVYILQWRTGPPTYANAQPFAARAVGWEGILAVHLWRELEDRTLAAAVRAHAISRMQNVLVPKLGTPPQPQWTAAHGVYPSNIWDARLDDPRLGAGWWWMPWQQSLGAYGLHLMGEQFGVPAACDKALVAARKVLADAWVAPGSTFAFAAFSQGAHERYQKLVEEEFGKNRTMASMGTDAPQWTSRAYAPLSGGGVHNTEFNHYGMPLAAWVVLKRAASVTSAEVERARAIIAQVKANATLAKHLAWIAPGVTIP